MNQGNPAVSRPTAQEDRTPTQQQVTVVGCVQREADYRRAHAAGRGGVAGTGVGVENEFILADASMSTDAAGSAARPPAVGTAGTAATAYELTGKNEPNVAQFIGRRVEITGGLKPAETGAAGPTGGPTAAAPPRGVDVASQDLRLRELEVTTVKETSGTCAPIR